MCAQPPPRHVILFHDGENVYIPASMRDGSRLFDLVLDKVFEMAGLGTGLDTSRVCVTWHYVVPRRGAAGSPTQTYQANDGVLDALRTRCCSGVFYHTLAGSRPGDVDVQLKQTMAQFLKWHLVRAEADDRDGDGETDTLVVLLTGDRDFAPEVGQLLRHGLPVIMLHRGNASKALRDLMCGKESDAWDSLVAACGGGRVELELDRLSPLLLPPSSPSSRSSLSSLSSLSSVSVSVPPSVRPPPGLCMSKGNVEVSMCVPVTWHDTYITEYLRRRFGGLGIVVASVNVMPKKCSAHCFTRAWIRLDGDAMGAACLRLVLLAMQALPLDDVTAVDSMMTTEAHVEARFDVSKVPASCLTVPAALFAEMDTFRVAVLVPHCWRWSDVKRVLAVYEPSVDVFSVTMETVPAGVQFKRAVLNLNTQTMSAAERRSVALRLVVQLPRLLYDDLSSHSASVWLGFQWLPLPSAVRAVRVSAASASAVAPIAPMRTQPTQPPMLSQPSWLLAAPGWRKW